MRINVKQHILDYEGKPLLADRTNSNGNSQVVKEPETARQYMVAALNNRGQRESDPMGAEESARRYQLSTKLYANNQVDLTLDEASLIKTCVPAFWGDRPLTFGRISDMLQGEGGRGAGGRGDDGRRVGSVI